MTRLFRVEEDGSYNEVPSQERLAGLGDAMMIAQNSGDGRYWYDYQNGQYHEISVANGQVVEFAHDAVKHGAPSVEFDRRQMEETVSDSVTQFGMILPADGVVGQPIDDSSRTAVEEF